MSIYLYEDAIIKELRAITGDGRIHIIDPSQAISFLAQFDKDKVTLPAIIMSRGSVSLTTETKNQVVALKGQTSRINNDNTVSKAQLLPIRAEWSLDILAADRYTCDEIIRELVFYFTQHPKFTVKIPYNLDIDQSFDIFLDSSIEDNSDLVDFPNTGEFFRETLSIYTENAHFYSSHRQYITQAIVDTEDNINNN